MRIFLPIVEQIKLQIGELIISVRNKKDCYVITGCFQTSRERPCIYKRKLHDLLVKLRFGPYHCYPHRKKIMGHLVDTKINFSNFKLNLQQQR